MLRYSQAAPHPRIGTPPAAPASQYALCASDRRALHHLLTQVEAQLHEFYLALLPTASKVFERVDQPFVPTPFSKQGR
jgi:hypothetical protein